MTKLLVDAEELLTVEEAAPALGISVPTAWRWIRDKKLVVVRVAGRTLIPKSEVDRLKEKTNEAV